MKSKDNIFNVSIDWYVAYIKFKVLISGTQRRKLELKRFTHSRMAAF